MEFAKTIFTSSANFAQMPICNIFFTAFKKRVEQNESLPEKLILLTNAAGLLDGDGALISGVTARQVDDMIAKKDKEILEI